MQPQIKFEILKTSLKKNYPNSKSADEAKHLLNSGLFKLIEIEIGSRI